MTVNRRKFVVGAAGLLFIRPATAAGLVTPRQTRGPFYPIRKPLDQDMDLTQIDGRQERAQGRVIELAGRVLKASGAPIERATLEIWQANSFGRYAHPGDPGGAESDPDFEGFGTVLTAMDGGYRFRTIKPAHYDLGPGSRRAPHIHVRVVSSTGGELVTQMYFPDEPLNATDGIYRYLPSDALRHAATASTLDGIRYRWDIVLP